MESLTRGTHWSVDPTGQRNKNRAGGAEQARAATAHRRRVRRRRHHHQTFYSTLRTQRSTWGDCSSVLATAAAAMADRWRWTTALLRWRPRRLNQTRGQASTSYWKP